MSDRIILLDLNLTLAKVVSPAYGIGIYNVADDVYRRDLADAIKDERIFLITAHTDNYADETKAKIARDLPFLKIERFYFKPIKLRRSVPAHSFKAMIVSELFDEGFEPSDFFAIEHSTHTQAEYSKLGVNSCSYATFMEMFHA